MCFGFTAEQRDFETHITDQTLLSVLAVRMWSYLTLILTKYKSLTVHLCQSETQFSVIKTAATLEQKRKQLQEILTFLLKTAKESGFYK